MTMTVVTGWNRVMLAQNEIFLEDPWKHTAEQKNSDKQLYSLPPCCPLPLLLTKIAFFKQNPGFQRSENFHHWEISLYYVCGAQSSINPNINIVFLGPKLHGNPWVVFSFYSLMLRKHRNKLQTFSYPCQLQISLYHNL